MLKIKGKEGKGKKPKLLDSSSSSESESEDKLGNETFNKKKDKVTDSEFSINKNYAGRYDNWRNLEEMQKLKSRLGVKNVDELNDEGSSESSTEDEEEWSTEKEKAFLKTLACLKKKDPKIYDGQFGYFKEVQETPGETNVVEEGGKKKKEEKKPFTVRDHERVMVLEKGGQHSDDEEEDDTQNTKSYPEELASIKSEFSKALKDIDSSDDEESGAVLGSNLLKKRAVKSEEEQQQEKEDYKLWLKGELEKVEKGKLSKEDKKDLKFLKEYWNDDKLDEGEKFLRDYILNKNYIEPLKGNAAGHIPSFNEVVHDDDELSNDEKFEEEREEFEHKYNFRFEEPDQEFIKRYPRTIQDSLRLRKEEGKRKETRDKAKDRKEEAKSRKRDEVQRLKALKRIEILDKIEKLHEITGNPDLDVREMDLEGDFDPEEYDKRMRQIFDDDYYQEEMDGEKPVFPYDEELDNEVNWEEWAPSVEKKKSTKENSSNEEEEDADANEPSTSSIEDSKRSQNKRSIQEELIEMSKGKPRNRKKRSAFLEALERQKPKFDPKVHKSFEQYFDEYYKLDFEDLVGDLPCRFKYHKTTPNNFGLSVDEILKASDRELNQWASIKKTFQYREENEEQYEVKAYMQKAQRDDLKRRLIPSVYQQAETTQADSESNEEEEGESEKQKKKRKKKIKKKNRKQNTSTSADQSAQDGLETDDLDTTSASVESSPPKKVKKVKSVEEDTGNVQLTDSTLIQESSPKTPLDGKQLSKRQRKNLKRKSGTSNNGIEVKNGNDSTGNVQTPVTQVEEGSKKKKKQSKSEKKWKGTKRKSEESNDINVDDARLEAYGLNPKKFKKRLKYGASVTKS
ncbi:unnamed protein product [Orchesella dallaii]|uniref:Protein KRI1 homolog n=1 Tax=Orchesella dallaii TaxID=48710 RepID=A0ABP1Q727_9HEXA